MDRITRQQIMEELLPLKQVLTREQYRRSSELLNRMSDYDFEQLLAEIFYMAEHTPKQEKPASAKEYAELIEEMRKANHVTSNNSALNDCPVHFLSDEENREFWNDISHSAPSDHICLRGKDDDAICSLWRQGDKKNEGIPSDLFFAGNVPLLDCSITVDERDKVNGQVCNYRVVIYEDYRERIDYAGDDAVEVGAAVIEEGGKQILIPIRVCRGFDMVMTGEIGWHGYSAVQRDQLMRHLSQQDLVSCVWALLATWYGIQIALLHPTVKTVFQNPEMERVYNPDARNCGSHRRITRYVKRHVIRAEDIDAAAYGESRNFTRHALVWYVIGHWRHYSDGRKVFIQPYWKGALRELKKNLDDRERRIDIEGGDEQ